MDLIEDGLLLAVVLRSLRSIPWIGDPPSRWTHKPPDKSGSNINTGINTGANINTENLASVSAKTLATIRGLLAKAEGTSFPAEAEAFAMKAQELMTRYSIDAAMLDTRHGSDLAAGVRARRFHLEQPYAKEKVSLLATVGSLNNVRIVYQTVYGMANAVGFEGDLEMTDLLFTSLLVQASRSLTITTKTAPRSSRASSPAFRRAFWLSYADRIGERLTAAHERAEQESVGTHGTALVPLLKERRDAIDARVDALFGRLLPMKTRSLDAQGWYAGRNAADDASLGVASGRLAR